MVHTIRQYTKRKIHIAYTTRFSRIFLNGGKKNFFSMFQYQVTKIQEPLTMV